MELTTRQKRISHIVEEQGPITGKLIAKQLNVTRAALRSDLAILTMAGILDARPKVGYYFLGRDHLNPVADKLETYTVKDIMSQAIVVQSKTSVHEATVTMFLEDVGTLLVGDEGYLQGVISRKDLLRSIMGKNNEMEVPLTMIMTPVSKIIFAEKDEPVLAAAERLIDFEVDCLPVIVREDGDDKGKYKIVGRLSKTNITRLFVECGKRFPLRQDV